MRGRAELGGRPAYTQTRVDWDDFDYEVDGGSQADEYEKSARDTLATLFDEDRQRVFFANQLAVLHERRFFHWVTGRAIDDLIGEGLVKTETRPLSAGGEMKLLWHKSHRYYKRDAKRVVQLVERYGSPSIRAALGLQAEALVLEGFAKREFVLRGRHANEFRGEKWTASQQNLDFIFERDEEAYGVEVKNTLSYMKQSELVAKIQMCEHLGVTPVFAVRMLPKNWINDLVRAGGYAMIMGYQLYPWSHADLAKELGLPVDAPRALAEGTMDRFMNWRSKKV